MSAWLRTSVDRFDRDTRGSTGSVHHDPVAVAGRHLKRHWTPEDVTAARHYNRALAVSVDADDFSGDDWSLLVAWFGGVCLRCGSEAVTVDHVVPLSRGGKNTISNIQALCLRCNASKGTTTRDYRDVGALVELLDLLSI